MMSRALAWCIVLVVCGAIWQYGSKWRSPWAIAAVPSVLTSLPPAHTGCTDACK